MRRRRVARRLSDGGNGDRRGRAERRGRDGNEHAGRLGRQGDSSDADPAAGAYRRGREVRGRRSAVHPGNGGRRPGDAGRLAPVPADERDQLQRERRSRAGRAAEGHQRALTGGPGRQPDAVGAVHRRAVRGSGRCRTDRLPGRYHDRGRGYRVQLERTSVVGERAGLQHGPEQGRAGKVRVLCGRAPGDARHFGEDRRRLRGDGVLGEHGRDLGRSQQQRHAVGGAWRPVA